MGPKKLTQSFTGYRIFWSFAISFIWLESLSLKREKYADEKVFLPCQKCFQLLCRRESSCLQGRVVATGRWLCLPSSMVSSSTLKYGMLPSVWYGTVFYGGPSWEPTTPIIGARGLYAGFFTFAPTTQLFVIQSHIEVWWENPLHNQASLQASNKSAFPNALTCPFIIRRVIVDFFWSKRNHFAATIFAAAHFESHLRLGWPVISFALETTIFRWPLSSTINNDTHTLVKDDN